MWTLLKYWRNLSFRNFFPLYYDVDYLKKNFTWLYLSSVCPSVLLASYSVSNCPPLKHRCTVCFVKEWTSEKIIRMKAPVWEDPPIPSLLLPLPFCLPSFFLVCLLSSLEGQIFFMNKKECQFCTRRVTCGPSEKKYWVKLIRFSTPQC